MNTLNPKKYEYFHMSGYFRYRGIFYMGKICIKSQTAELVLEKAQNEEKLEIDS